MSNRFHLALTSIEQDSLPLSQIAENLMLAAREAETEGVDVFTDPAVVLIGEQARFYAPRRVDRAALLHDCAVNNDVRYPTIKERH